MGTCRGSLHECPFVQKYQEKLTKTKCSYEAPGKYNCNKNGKKATQGGSTKTESTAPAETERQKMQKNKSNEMEKSKDEKDDKSVCNSVTMIRSTRAQDLRSQCNRDQLKPKSVCEKTRVISPYAPVTNQKKKRSVISPNSDTKDLTNRSLPTPKHVTEDKKPSSKAQSKSATVQSARKYKREKMKENSRPLEREKTQEVIHPKFVRKERNGIGDCGDSLTLKKSQTFFICKGPKRGEGDDVANVKVTSSTSSTDNSDSEYEEPPSPEPNPLTHNDSFCLIAKSSLSWSQKRHYEDQNSCPMNVIHPTGVKKDEKGILKSSNRDLKSVDSAEKIEPEKIVRFSDELVRKRKVLRKYVRRKNKLQNTIAAAWYRKNKQFQKYLQVLRTKSVLHANQDDLPFQVPVHLRERYEAEMLGLVPRKSTRRFTKGRSKRFNY